MPVRTDLALESLRLTSPEAGELEGIRSEERLRGGTHVVEVEVLNGRGAEAISKPVGRYVTVEAGPLLPETLPALAEALADELESFLPEDRLAPAMVVGLGNRAVTPDALGPLAAERTMVTRHLVEFTGDGRFRSLRPVSVLTPGVLGTTGIESADLIAGAAERMKPAVILAVDALASLDVTRLCSTVQISSSGIVPGSGVGNSRAALDRKTLGVPVIAVGVPTVVDAATVAEQLTGAAPRESRYGSMFVTPRDIDRLVGGAARLVGAAISMALHDVDYDYAVEWTEGR